MNVELLRKVVEHVELEPRRFNMHEWYVDATGVVCGEIDVCNLDVSSFFDENGSDVPPCGVVGCIAGTTCIISGKAIGFPRGIINGRKLFEYKMPIGGWAKNAQKLLELTDDQAERLFYPGYWYAPLYIGSQLHSENTWPEPFAGQYFRNRYNPEERVKILRARVEHFIATNGAE